MSVVLMGGFDGSGYAGILADQRVCQAMGVSTAVVLTSLTAQSQSACLAVEPVSPEMLLAQLEAVPIADIQAIKIGLLGSVAQLDIVLPWLIAVRAHHAVTVVVDPVWISTSGVSLFPGDAETFRATLLRLAEHVDIVTPNWPEASQLLGTEVGALCEVPQAAQGLRALGFRAVLLKGGHAPSGLSQDYWLSEGEAFWLASPRVQGVHRGTGCTLASSVAAAIADGASTRDALVQGKLMVNRWVQGLPLRRGVLQAALPYVSAEPLCAAPEAFPSCGDEPLGFYPIVDSTDWMQRLLPLGVKTLQLRIKNQPMSVVAAEIQDAVALANKYGVRLFINDYWELAIASGAYGVHLGQEDLIEADVARIRQAGLRLGISTHSLSELARAHAFSPSYIAFGPIFPTTIKIMAAGPQGVGRLVDLCQGLTYPVVAIGGINFARFSEVLQARPSGIAVISAVTAAADPIGATHAFLAVPF